MKLIVSKKELWMQQAPNFNFEKNADELLQQALRSGFVDKVGVDQYEINANYHDNQPTAQEQ
jgi:hypothetical protein|tara:strand:+ start:95 stop:280 length:186 start_codon:yes stop_codon:yes gene_type:complete